MYKQSKYVLALFLGTSKAYDNYDYDSKNISFAQDFTEDAVDAPVATPSPIPEEKIEHANTAGSMIRRSDVAPLKNGSA
jgi:hypothetical protein